MAARRSPPEQGVEFYTEVDDELYQELAELTGQRVAHISVWEESVLDAIQPTDLELDVEPAGQAHFDLDLYLADGVYFELYGTLCYPSLEEEPRTGLEAVSTWLAHLVHGGLWLEEVAVDEENALVLVLARQHRPVCYLVVGAWLLAEWEELPAEA